MEITQFTVGVFRVNTYLLRDEATGKCAIVDTGESDELATRLQSLDPPPDIQMILLTHGHLDHAGGLPYLQAAFDVPTYLPRLEKPLFDTLPQQGDWFNNPAMNCECGRIDHWLDDGDHIQLGDTVLRFISTPSHTPGQGCYYDEQDVFVGDTIFAGSVGRTDLPLGNPDLMENSLRKLMTLPHALRVHSGHGRITTLGDELENNSYLQFLREG